MEDKFFNVKETTINVSSAKRAYKFIQISDTHICAFDELSTPEEKEEAISHETRWDPVKADFAHHFGDPFGPEQEITTVEAFKKLIDYAKSENPDALIISGDVLDYMHGAGGRFLKSELSRFGGKVICVGGNHEGEVLEGVWNNFSEHSFGDFKIVALDDRKKTITDDTLAKLKASLSGGVDAIVVMHIPFATDLNREDMKKFSEYFVIDEQSCDDNAKELVSLLKNSKNVKAVLCGHVHGWHESVFAENKTQYCCSASMIGNVRKIVVE